VSAPAGIGVAVHRSRLIGIEDDGGDLLGTPCMPRLCKIAFCVGEAIGVTYQHSSSRNVCCSFLRGQYDLNICNGLHMFAEERWTIAGANASDP
jgi:hypothetical protein